MLPDPERYPINLRDADIFVPEQTIFAKVAVDLEGSPWICIAWAGRYHDSDDWPIYPYFTFCHRYEVTGLEE